jgi:hypothetical protein
MTKKQREAKNAASKRCVARKKAKALYDSNETIPNIIWHRLFIGLSKDQVQTYVNKNPWVSKCGNQIPYIKTKKPKVKLPQYKSGDLVITYMGEIGVITQALSGSFYTFSKGKTSLTVQGNDILCKCGDVDLVKWKAGIDAIANAPRGADWGDLIAGKSLILLSCGNVAKFLGYKSRNTKYPVIIKFLTGIYANNERNYKVSKQRVKKEITETEFKLMQIK